MVRTHAAGRGPSARVPVQVPGRYLRRGGPRDRVMLQTTGETLFRKLPFARLVKEIVQQEQDKKSDAARKEYRMAY